MFLFPSEKVLATCKDVYSGVEHTEIFVSPFIANTYDH